MTLKASSRFFFASVMLLLTALAVTAGMAYRNRINLIESQSARVEAYRLAEELLQNSSDLTRFAQTYAAIGDKEFERRYRGVAVIMEDFKARHKRSGLPPDLRALLEEAQAASDALAATETRAMALAVAGDKPAAARLLFGEDYERARRTITEPIAEFLRRVNARSESTIQEATARSLSYVRRLFVIIFLMIAFVAWSQIVSARHVVAPIQDLQRQTADVAEALRRLADVSRSIAGGNYRAEFSVGAARFTSSHRDEVGELIRLHDDMISCLEETGRSITRMTSGLGHAHDELADVHARLKSVVNAASQVSIIATDLQGAITLFNSGAEKLLGYGAEEIVGRRTPEVFHVPSELEAYGRKLSAESGRTISGFEALVAGARSGGFDRNEWTYIRKDGTRFPMELVVTAVRDRNGDATGFLGVAVDLSERKRLEAEVLRARDAAVELARMKSEFLANMSHEIRTPMNAVIGMTDLLLDTPLDSRQRDYLETVRHAGDALLDIINDILDFSKLESGKVQLEDMDYDLRETLELTLDLFASRARQKGLKLTCSVDDAVPALLRGDAGRVRQILVNYMGNALKFSDKGAIVLRAALSPDGALRLEVRDSGIGIAPEARSRIFASFTQADSSTTRKYGGTGLGLAISKGLAELMGGRVGVESELGAGSTFWAELPLRKAASAAPSPAPAAPTRLRDKSPRWHFRILLVEDNAVNRKVATLMLEKLGCVPSVAGNGLKALEALEAAPFDLILMDCQMPEMDGFEAAAEIRRREAGRKHTPIVAMTANALAGDRERCLAAGMDDYLAKPVRLQDLAAMIERFDAPVDPSLLADFESMTSSEDRRELVRVYLEDAPPRLAALAEALGSGNVERAILEAHSLKGSSGSVGGKGLQARAARTESALRAGRAAEAAAELPGLLEEWERVKTALGG